MKRALTAMLLTLVFTVASFAHGGAKHVMGTVKDVSKQSITIVTQDNQRQTVALTTKTTFVRSGQAAG